MKQLDDIYETPPKIIFIMGFPRSGTTYLQSLISTQPSIVSFPETHFFSSITGDLQLNNNDSLSLTQFQLILGRLEKIIAFSFSIEILLQMRKSLNQQKLSVKNVFIFFVSELLNKRKVGLEEKVILEKTPDHIRYIGRIANIFPDAQFIIIVRHPVDAVNSFYHNLVEWRDNYMNLALQWKESLSKVNTLRSYGNHEIYLVKFEDLINSRDNEMQKIFKFLDIDLQLELLDNFNITVEDLILPNEHWKANNREKYYKSKKLRINLYSLLCVQAIAIREMIDLGYNVKYPTITKIFNGILYTYIEAFSYLKKIKSSTKRAYNCIITNKLGKKIV